MSAAAIDVLAAVRAAGGDLKVAGGNLRLMAPAPLPVEMIEQIRAAKPNLLALLSSNNNRARLERKTLAAAEPDFGKWVALIGRGELPEEWAEGFARINTIPMPAAYDAVRWHRLIDDGGRFLDRWGNEAARLGWNTASLFGVGKAAPDVRHDLKGVITALNGADVVEIGADRAKLRTPSGAFQTYYRRPTGHGQVMLWELRHPFAQQQTKIHLSGRSDHIFFRFSPRAS